MIADFAGFAPNVVLFLSALTLIGQGIAAVVALTLLTRLWPRMRHFVSRNGLLLMFIVALVATCGSLYFSDIAGWTPCKDCWLQRIFMYPQVPLLALALWLRDRRIASYILLLCVIGAFLSAFHYHEQVLAALHPVAADPLKPCDATGVSCAKTEIHFTFGYITIPLMALTAFVLNGCASLCMLKKKA